MDTEMDKVLDVTQRAVCPSHPGEILKDLYLDGLKMSVTAFATDIGVSRKAISAIVNRRKSVTPEMAMRFAKAIGTTPQLWLNLQNNYDLWHLSHGKSETFASIHPLVPSMA